jgi:hypothetical protein
MDAYHYVYSYVWVDVSSNYSSDWTNDWMIYDTYQCNTDARPSKKQK